MLDNVVDFVTNPIVVLVLLPIISLLFITSLFTKGLGIGGILGSILLVLFFAAHSIEGYSSPGLIFFIFDWRSIYLFRINHTWIDYWHDWICVHFGKYPLYRS